MKPNKKNRKRDKNSNSKQISKQPSRKEIIVPAKPAIKIDQQVQDQAKQLLGLPLPTERVTVDRYSPKGQPPITTQEIFLEKPNPVKETLSPREVLWMGQDSKYRKEIYWRNGRNTLGLWLPQDLHPLLPIKPQAALRRCCGQVKTGLSIAVFDFDGTLVSQECYRRADELFFSIMAERGFDSKLVEELYYKLESKAKSKKTREGAEPIGLELERKEHSMLTVYRNLCMEKDIQPQSIVEHSIKAAAHLAHNQPIEYLEGALEALEEAKENFDMVVALTAGDCLHQSNQIRKAGLFNSFDEIHYVEHEIKGLVIQNLIDRGMNSNTSVMVGNSLEADIRATHLFVNTVHITIEEAWRAESTKPICIDSTNRFQVNFATSWQEAREHINNVVANNNECDCG